MNPLFPDENAAITWGDYFTYKLAWMFVGWGLGILAFSMLAIVAMVKRPECPKCGRAMQKKRGAVFWTCLFDDSEVWKQ